MTTRTRQVALWVVGTAAAAVAVVYASRPTHPPVPANLAPAGDPNALLDRHRDGLLEAAEASRREIEAAVADLRRTSEPAPVPHPDPLQGLWLTAAADSPQVALWFVGRRVSLWVAARGLVVRYPDAAFERREAAGGPALAVTVPGLTGRGLPAEFRYAVADGMLTLTVPDGAARGDHRLRPARPVPDATRATVVYTGKPSASVTQSSNGRESSLTAGGTTQVFVKDVPRSPQLTMFLLPDKTTLWVEYPPADGPHETEYKPVAVEGTLSVRTDPFAVVRRETAAKTPLLVAARVTPLTPETAGRYPPEDTATITGELLKGDVPFGGQTAGWAIRDGDGRIPLVFPPGLTPPAAGRVRASGELKLVGTVVGLVVRAVEPVPPG